MTLSTEYTKLTNLEKELAMLLSQIKEVESEIYQQKIAIVKTRSKARLSVNSVKEALKLVNTIAKGKIVGNRIVVKNTPNNHDTNPLKRKIESKTNIGVLINTVYTPAYKDCKGYEIFLTKETIKKIDAK